MGRDFGAITRSGNYNVIIGATEKDVADKLEWVREHYRPRIPADRLDSVVEQFRSGPLVGTPEQCVETLRTAQAAGLDYAITYFIDSAYDRSSVELFEREVVPALS